MMRLKMAGVVVAVTASSCSGPGLFADSSANTFAGSTAEGSGPDSGTTTTLGTADATAPSGELTGDPGSAAETNGCAAAGWDDGRWDEACWQ